MATPIPGHPVGAAAALACWRDPASECAQGQRRRPRGGNFKGLQALQDKHDIVGDVRGVQAVAALELVSDHARPRSTRADQQGVQEIAYEQRLLIRVSGPNIVLLAPAVLCSTRSRRSTIGARP